MDLLYKSSLCNFYFEHVSFIGIISVGFDNFKLDFVKFFVPRNVNNMPLLGF